MPKPTILFALLLAAVVAHAQQPTAAGPTLTPPALEARLLQKPLLLRNLYMNDLLAFDATGALKNFSQTGPFTLAGIDVQKLEIRHPAGAPASLRIDAQRVGLTGPLLNKRLPLVSADRKPEAVIITIDADAKNSFDTALDAIFTEKLADLAPAMPPFWHTYALRNILNESAEPNAGIPGPGGEILPPVLTTHVPAAFTQQAVNLHVTGTAVFSLVIDAEGRPTNAQLVQPIGLGLDEQAYYTVLTYRFKPATRDGKPVPVRITFEISFGK